METKTKLGGQGRTLEPVSVFIASDLYGIWALQKLGRFVTELDTYTSPKGQRN